MWSGGVSRTTERSGGGRQANRHTTCSKHTYLSFLKWTIRLLDVRGLRQRQSHEEPVRPTWYPIAVELSKLVLLGLDSGTRAQIWSSFQYTILSQKQQLIHQRLNALTSPPQSHALCDSRAEHNPPRLIYVWLWSRRPEFWLWIQTHPLCFLHKNFLLEETSETPGWSVIMDNAELTFKCDL